MKTEMDMTGRVVGKPALLQGGAEMGGKKSVIAKSMMDVLRKLAGEEKARAQKQHGKAYASMHEGVGVLAEEVQEAGDSLADVVTSLDTLIRVHRRGEDTGDGLREIYRYALLTAAECIQVAAVCLKAAQGEAEHAG